MNEDADVSCKRLYVYVCTYIPIQKKKDIFCLTFMRSLAVKLTSVVIILVFFLYSDCRIVFFLLFFYLYFFIRYLIFFSIERPQSFNCCCHNFYVIQPGCGFLRGFDILHATCLYIHTYIYWHWLLKKKPA